MRAVILMACVAFVLSAQGRQVSARVPLVGCAGDGMLGPVEAPQGAALRLPIPAAAAARLAYYKSAPEIGVLAPRGWHCYYEYGSGGYTLLVSPEPIDQERNLPGAGIDLTFHNGMNSGRIQVAEVIARVFPSRMSFVAEVRTVHELQEGAFPVGPFATDRLTRRGERVVEFVTPAGAEGLGTRSRLSKGKGGAISGVTILQDDVPNILQLSVRLPDGMQGLTAIVIGQLEREAAKLR